MLLQHSEDSSKAVADAQKPSEDIETHEKQSASMKTVCSSSTPKKCLVLSLSQNEKHLNWDRPENNLINTKHSLHHKDKVGLFIAYTGNKICFSGEE